MWGGVDTSDGTATSRDILIGKSAYVNDEKITGTIPSKSAATITPSTSNQIISSGQYLSGTQTIKGDSNLKASNIKKGVSIFGVSGSLVEGSLENIKTIWTYTSSNEANSSFYNTSSSNPSYFCIKISYDKSLTPIMLAVAASTTVYSGPDPTYKWLVYFNSDGTGNGYYWSQQQKTPTTFSSSNYNALRIQTDSSDSTKNILTFFPYDPKASYTTGFSSLALDFVNILCI